MADAVTAATRKKGRAERTPASSAGGRYPAEEAWARCSSGSAAATTGVRATITSPRLIGCCSLFMA